MHDIRMERSSLFQKPVAILDRKFSWEGLERNIKTYTNLSPDTGALLPFPSAQDGVGA
jgi:hypothetical protein